MRSILIIIGRGLILAVLYTLYYSLIVIRKVFYGDRPPIRISMPKL